MNVTRIVDCVAVRWHLTWIERVRRLADLVAELLPTRRRGIDHRRHTLAQIRQRKGRAAISVAIERADRREQARVARAILQSSVAQMPALRCSCAGEVDDR